MLEHGMMLSLRSTRSEYDLFGDGSGEALYTMNGTVADSHGLYTGNPLNITYATGVFGQAAVTNGTTAGILSISSTLATILRTAASFTITAWINTNVISASTQRVVGLLNDTYLVVNVINGYPSVTVLSSTSVNTTVTSSLQLNTGIFYNIIVTGDAVNGIKMYIDTVLVGSGGWDGTFLTYTNASYRFNAIGVQQSTVTHLYCFNGLIDQVRIISKSVTQNEVIQLYNEEI